MIKNIIGNNKQIIPLLWCLKLINIRISKYISLKIILCLTTFIFEKKRLTLSEVQILVNNYKIEFEGLILRYGSLEQIKAIGCMPNIRSIYRNGINDLNVVKYIIKNRKILLTYYEFSEIIEYVKNSKIHKYLLNFVETQIPDYDKFKSAYLSGNTYLCYYWIKCGANFNMLDPVLCPYLFEKI